MVHYGYFLLVRQWKPNFVAEKAKQIHTVVWVRLPQLRTKFYNGIILKTIGKSIGNLLKIDACTSATLRGRYARLCIELPLDRPVQTCILIGTHLQQLVYEGNNFICKNCGHLGHTANTCIQAPKNTEITLDYNNGLQDLDKERSIPQPPPEDQWHVVTFNRRRNQGKEKSTEKQHINSLAIISQPGTSIDVKIYDAVSGKYLNTQKLTYKAINNSILFNNSDNMGPNNINAIPLPNVKKDELIPTSNIFDSLLIQESTSITAEK